ncbi:MAG: hypothetical protein GQF41_0997 [Candidatus Rifleibacterium amylolyticum]|nr:MAG: hypothetical protein GQF41_0997 [Candidatus Rifleibacterium amylolyticum]
MHNTQVEIKFQPQKSTAIANALKLLADKTVAWLKRAVQYKPGLSAGLGSSYGFSR